jgi:hypothetical protein
VIPVLVGVERSVAAENFGWIIRNLELIIMPAWDGQEKGFEKITQALQALEAAA